MNNEEINNLKQIIGLKQNQEYSSTKDLRYGKVIILTDADTDGTHIRSLFVNFIHAQWPSLLKLHPSFIQTIRTPIVKAIKGKKILEFFTENDYNIWKETHNTTGYQIRYFKGLGTSKKEDAQDTFKRIDNLKIEYFYKDNQCDDSIILAFEKDKNVSVTTEDKCSDKRKRWLENYDRNIYVTSEETRVSFRDLIHKELIHFSIYDNLRSIPSLCDGLKPSQRKILFYMLKKNISKVIKVAQLSGYVSAETGYHHGEASLQQAIIGMAQDFVGTNNINLLFPDGNFGSRLLSGKDAASPRYIFTKLTELTQLIFNKLDSPLLTYLDDDGTSIEPEWFLPVIPMILVNGCEGIGTGFSTYIPPHNPRDIIENILRLLNGQQMLPLIPHFKNFGGNVYEVNPDSGSYVTKGIYERLSQTQVKISELPIGTSVTSYKEYLESLIETKGTQVKTTKSKTKKQIYLKDVQNKTRDENTQICFIVEFKSVDDLEDLILSDSLEKYLKLTKTFSTNNMYLFNHSLKLTKYQTANDILSEFFYLRLEFYEKRRQYLIKKLTNELVLLNSKMRFINEYINGDLDINRKSKSYIISLLEEREYPKIKSEESDSESTQSDYDYLIKMPLVNLSKEKIEDLQKQCVHKESELNKLQHTSNKELWKSDLDDIVDKLN
jgi:DNA topoisomerase-2